MKPTLPWHKQPLPPGEPRPRPPRCPCGKVVLLTARRRNHHCTPSGPIPAPPRNLSPHERRLRRILDAIHPGHLERLLQGIEIALRLRPPDPEIPPMEYWPTGPNAGVSALKIRPAGPPTR